MSVPALTRRLGEHWSLRAWILERVRLRRAPSPLPYVLEHRTIFVLPTLFGLGFGVLLLFMVLGGLNFNNNLALLLVFALGVIVQATTLLAYRNLRGLSVRAIRAEPVFAGATAEFTLYLENPEPRLRFALMAGLTGETNGDCIDIAAVAEGQVRLKLAAPARGWLTLPAVRLETTYPLGMFRAWSWLFPTARCLVYPRPASPVPTLPVSGAGESGRARLGEGEQVHGLREYRAGDSLRRVAWRTSARHDTLLTREMETPQELSCRLAWDVLAGQDAEARLSVLTAWVLAADHLGLDYSLEIPGTTIAPGRGAEHRARCLQALALYGR